MRRIIDHTNSFCLSFFALSLFCTCVCAALSLPFSLSVSLQVQAEVRASSVAFECWTRRVVLSIVALSRSTHPFTRFSGRTYWRRSSDLWSTYFSLSIFGRLFFTWPLFFCVTIAPHILFTGTVKFYRQRTKSLCLLDISSCLLALLTLLSLCRCLTHAEHTFLPLEHFHSPNYSSPPSLN